MKFIFAENMDLVDPKYDFIKDRNSPDREPYWSDVYPHELLGFAPYDGLLVSRAIIGGHLKAGKYSESQAMRFRRIGARDFLRYSEKDYPNSVIWGDCGAFAYAKEEYPPYSVDDIVEFYDDGRFTHGCSVDHIIFDFYESDYELTFDLSEPRRRQEICIANADEFFTKSKKVIGEKFTPVGVVHGWSPQTMASAAVDLIKMGYKYLALGGMVPLNSKQIMSALNAVREVIPKETKLHILGFAKANTCEEFLGKGIDSIDTTSPLLQAFKDVRRNYHVVTAEGYDFFGAIKIPPALENNGLKKLVQSGQIDLELLLGFEKAAIKSVRSYASYKATVSEVVESLRAYWELVFKGKAKVSSVASFNEIERQVATTVRTLESRPWETCDCPICEKHGVEVLIFRGNNRNRRRGVHNLFVYGRYLKKIQGIAV